MSGGLFAVTSADWCAETFETTVVIDEERPHPITDLLLSVSVARMLYRVRLEIQPAGRVVEKGKTQTRVG
jgi:hypothetical protein